MTKDRNWQDGATIMALMSGTSVDSIDAAICRLTLGPDERFRCEVLSFYEHEMSAALRRRIFEAFADGTGSLSLACSLNFEIGRAFADAALGALQQWGQPSGALDAIASHGQTLYHIAPHMAREAPDRWVASTLQLGEPSILAAATGVPVISNFRTADMALGGNGAPLVPFADYHLFTTPDRGRVIHNLGGIGNCTWLPAGGGSDDVLAFDTGPANMIIDALVSRFYPGEAFDADGAHAAAGSVIEPLLQQWMALPYISAAPPKSTGRELFGLQFAEEAIRANPAAAPDDLIATATEFTAASLAENLRRFVGLDKIDEILLAGGGARNAHLVQQIAAQVDGARPRVALLDEAGGGITSKNRECVGFALLGYAHLLGLPGNLPSVTGASRPAILGQYTPVP